MGVRVTRTRNAGLLQRGYVQTSRQLTHLRLNESAADAFGANCSGPLPLFFTSLLHDTSRPVFSPWVRPSPKQHAYLLFGFCLARANARMLINAASKRSSAKNAVRASRPRSTSQVAVNG